MRDHFLGVGNMTKASALFLPVESIGDERCYLQKVGTSQSDRGRGVSGT